MSTLLKTDLFISDRTIGQLVGDTGNRCQPTHAGGLSYLGNNIQLKHRILVEDCLRLHEHCAQKNEGRNKSTNTSAALLQNKGTL
jgi:hypothetical protein